MLVLDNLAVFEFGVICEVFGIDRSNDGVPNFDFKVCGPQPGRALSTSVGAQLVPDHGLDDLLGADLVAVPAISGPPESYLPEALEALRNNSCDVVLMDCQMPKMDGFDLITSLRSNPAYKYVPILILTTESDPAKKERGKAAGATGWIVKPFNPEKLVQVVQKVCP